MQLFPKIPPAPTTILDISDLRDPNQFDWALLEEEGTRQGAIVIRGASLVADTRREPTPPPVPVKAAPPAPIAFPEPAMAYAPSVTVLRLPEIVTAPPVSTPAPRASLVYAGLLSACICVAGSLALFLGSIL